MEAYRIQDFGDELHAALRGRRMLAPLTERAPGITLADAYRISRRLLERRLGDGEKVVGKKIGATNKVVQNMLNIHQPDFGWLTDAMQFTPGGDVPISELLIQPRAEGEIAFLLKDDLRGPGVTAADVLAASEAVMPCFEIVDSRIRDWKIKIEDTVADNASCGLFVISEERFDPRDLDLVTCGMVLEFNGEIATTGAGAAALGSPLNAVAWLANAFGEFGSQLEAGDIVLSGALVPLMPVKAGDAMTIRAGGMGCVSIRFT